MRVHVHPADAGACALYRLREPLRVLSATHDVSEPTETLTCAWDRPPGPGARVVDVVRPDCDVAVFQRPLRRHMVEAIDALQRRGVACVVEVDDLFSAIHAGNPAFRDAHPDDPDHNWRWLAEACKRADLVTVTTPALAEAYGRHGRVAILPNLVPARYLAIGEAVPRKPVPLVGYAGSSDTHPGDLAVTGGAVAEVLATSGARFRAIGGIRTCSLLGVRGETLPPVSLDDWPIAVATLDVGIAPLVDNLFNRCKSWLKPLEHAALGVACIASPTPEYARAAREGMCVLATRPREWRRELRRMLDPAERAAQVLRARTAARRHTYEEHAERWWDAWRLALDHRVRAAA